MRSILCYLLFAIGGTVTYVCAEEKEQIGSDTLENILFVDDFDAKCIVPDTAIWKTPRHFYKSRCPYRPSTSNSLPPPLHFRNHPHP